MKNPPEGLPFGVHGSSFILDIKRLMPWFQLFFRRRILH